MMRFFVLNSNDNFMRRIHQFANDHYGNRHAVFAVFPCVTIPIFLEPFVP